MPDDLTTRPVTGADTLRRGVPVLWRGIQDEPAMFALAVVGSALYGAGTAGAGWLLGHLTQTVLAPAFAAGHVTGAQLGLVGFGRIGQAVARRALGFSMRVVYHDATEPPVSDDLAGRVESGCSIRWSMFASIHSLLFRN